MRKKARRRPPLSMTTLCFNILHEMRLTDGDEENLLRVPRKGHGATRGWIHTSPQRPSQRDVIFRNQASLKGVLLPRAVRQVVEFTKGE